MLRKEQLLSRPKARPFRVMRGLFLVAFFFPSPFLRAMERGRGGRNRGDHYFSPHHETKRSKIGMNSILRAPHANCS